MANAVMYRIKCDSRVVDKQSYINEAATSSSVNSHTKTLDCTFIYPTNIINPVLRIEVDVDEMGRCNPDLTQFNYCMLDVGSFVGGLEDVDTDIRYYFVTNVEFVSLGIFNVYLHEDVLMTFREQFLPLDAMIGRNENGVSGVQPIIADKLRPFDDSLRIVEKRLDNLFSLFFKNQENDDYQPNLIVVAATPIVSFEYDNTKNYGDVIWERPPIGKMNPWNKSYTIFLLRGKGLIESFYKQLYGLVEYQSYIIGTYLLPFDISMARGLISDTPILYGFNRLQTSGENQYDMVLNSPTSQKLLKLTVTGEAGEVVWKADSNPYFSHQIEIRPEELSSIIPDYNFMGVEPYSTYHLWLPAVGWVELPSDAMIKFREAASGSNTYTRMFITLSIDLSDGSGVYFIDFGGPIGETGRSLAPYHMEPISAQIGLPLPITGENADEVQRNKTAYQLQQSAQNARATANMVSGGLNAVSKSFNPFNPIGGAIEGVTGIVSAAANTAGDLAAADMEYRANEVRNVTYGNHTALYSYTLSLLSAHEYVFQRRYKKSSVENEQIYAHILGIPVKTCDKMSNFHGFTTIETLKLDINSTETEKTEIMALLQRGVYLP